MSSPPRDMLESRYGLGVAMVLTAGLCLSIGGVLLRSMESATGWQVMFYRSITFALTVLVVVAWRYRGRTPEAFRAIGRAGIAVGVISGAGSIAYIFALLTTTVANTMFIVSVTPLCTALLAWAVLGERPRTATWLAIAIAIAGIAVMFSQGVTDSRLLGSLLAFAAAVGMAAMIVIIRRAKDIDMVPAQCLGGLIAAMVAALMVDTFVVPAGNLGRMVVLGVVQIGAGFMLVTIGARYVPAAQVSLLMLSEMVLAPIWVWLAVDEVPAMVTLVGGILVMAAVISQAVAGLREERARKTAEATL
ncbi:MAG: DMT family transporter [Alphaproteobacteria bacterium]